MQTSSVPSLVADGAAVADFFTGFLMVGAGMLLVVVLGVTLTAWLLYRRIRRSGRIRRSALRSVLTVRSYAADAVTRQLARLRLTLLRAGEATERSLAAARAQRRPVGELPLVAANLERTGQLLDGQLRLVEREPDPVLRRSLAAGLQEQVGQVSRMSSQLRGCLLENGHTVGSSRLEQASAHLALEVDAFQAWGQSYGHTAPARMARANRSNRIDR